MVYFRFSKALNYLHVLLAKDFFAVNNRTTLTIQQKEEKLMIEVPTFNT